MPSTPHPATPLRRRAALVLALLAAFLLALPAAAYTIYLKDGSRLVAQDEYEVRDGRAYFVLQNGTGTFIDVNQIDVERTREANKGNLGTATVIEGGETLDAPVEREAPAEPTLGDLIQRRQATAGAERPPAEREMPETNVATVERTVAGFPDLAVFDRRAFGDMEMGAELKQFFTNQGLEDARIFQGTAAGRPLVEVTANSEASVFRALAVAASALVHLREKGRSTAALELFLQTSNRNRAGQFLLTPEASRALLSGDVDVATFYLQNVQF